jgi:hypothetical protein
MPGALRPIRVVLLFPQGLPLPAFPRPTR